MIPRVIFRLLAPQFRHPRGIVGRWVGKQMEKLNDAQNDWVLSLLHLKPDDRVLEIGFGTGLTMQKIAKKLPKGKIAGIDISVTMLGMAKELLKTDIAAGKVSLYRANADRMPFQENSFSKVFAVHVVYFWRNLQEVFKELYRVTKPGGTLALYYVASVLAESDAFIIYTEKQIKDALRKAGFQSVSSYEKQFGPQRGICITAIK
ncbi:methyltransferase domain-containing protein [Candidatus Roizmanbacteria bacterium]|nr:methyltransferase domain-containing protein [Candidatus Roizmanbacteria bacterium]